MASIIKPFYFLLYSGLWGVSLLFGGTVQAADLSINVSARPAQGTLDQELTYTVSLFPVRTSESKTVNDVLFSYGVPTGFTLQSATPSQGTCVTGEVLECDMGSLDSLQTVEIVVIPTQEGTVTSSMFVAGLKLNEDTNQVETTRASVTVTTTVVEPPPVQLDFSATSISVSENGGEAVISVSLTGDNSDRDISVDYATSDGTATAGVDYSAASGTLSWAKGDKTEKTFRVLIENDQVLEKDETINLTLSNVSGASIGAGSAVLTIVSDESAGTLGFSAVSYRAFESAGEAVITVNRNDGGDGTVSVTYGTADGSGKQGEDYLATNGTLVWGNGDTGPKSFTVVLLTSEEIRGDRSVNLFLNAADQAVLGQRSAVLTIIDSISEEDAVAALEQAARNPVQKAMAKPLGTLCQSGQAGKDLQARCRELVLNAASDPDAVANALQQIAPEELASQGHLALEASSRQFRNIRTRLMALRSGAKGASLKDLKVDVQGVPVPEAIGLPKTDAPIPSSLPSDVAHKYGLNKLGLFISGDLSFGDRSASEREGGFDFSVASVTGGADYRFSDTFLVGAAFGYSQGDADFHASGGKIGSDSYTYSLYATFYQAKKFYIDGIYSFGTTDYDTERNVFYQIADTRVSQVAHSSVQASRSALVLEAGYDFEFDKLRITPTARIDRLKVDIDPFRESMSNYSNPGSGLALGFNEQSLTSTTLALGVQANYELKTEWATLKPDLQFELIKEMDNDSRLLSGYFVDDRGAQAFALSTDEPDTLYFSLGAGLSIDYGKGQTLFVNYQSLLGMDKLAHHSLMAGFRFEF